jgi:small subunit ribosomal protein S4e
MSKHLKRLAAPRRWSIPKKTQKWTVKPSPGPHSKDKGISVLLVIRDYMKYCDTGPEARRIIGAGMIHVDGNRIRDYKRPLGIMDVISIPTTKENFRVLIDNRGKLKLIKISKTEAKWKLARIENKVTIKSGKIQLNLHDGRNILIKKNKYKTGDVLKIELPSQKILAEYTFEKGNTAMVIDGKHAGQIAPIYDYEVMRSSQPNIVHFKEFSTIKDNVFVIGHEKPEITIPEASAI